MLENLDCLEARQKSNSFFEGLSQKELDKLQEEKKLAEYKSGDILFHAGDMPAGLFWIETGKIKLYKPGTHGREQIVRLYSEGELLGYRAMICNERYAATAKALEASKIGFVPVHFFQEVVRNNTELPWKLLGILCSDLKIAEERAASLSQLTVRERLADILLYLKNTFGTKEDQQTMNIRMTRKDLAALTGTANETLIRLLRDFKDEGYIDLNGKDIAILYPDKLEKIAMGRPPL